MSAKRTKFFRKTMTISLVANGILVVVLLLIYWFSRQQYYQQAEQRFQTAYERRAQHLETLPNGSEEIVFLGNSLTAECNWAELLEDHRVVNRGIDGDRLSLVLHRIAEVVESKPTRIFLMMGTNDLGKDQPDLDQLIASYEKILKEIKVQSPATQIFVQSLLPVNPKLGEKKRNNENMQAFNQKLEALAASLETEYIDLYASFTEEGRLKETYSNDGLHLNGAGYQHWKKQLAPYLGKKPKPTMFDPERLKDQDMQEDADTLTEI